MIANATPASELADRLIDAMMREGKCAEALRIIGNYRSRQGYLPPKDRIALLQSELKQYTACFRGTTMPNIVVGNDMLQLFYAEEVYKSS